jgi:branched-chain amino acid transport system permease protein
MPIVDQSRFRKKDFLLLGPMWLLSLILPDPLPRWRRRHPKRDLFYLLVIIVLPLVWSDPHMHHVMILAGIHAILALGLALFIGYAGQISLGHGSFFGIGAYTTAILTTQHGWPPLLALGASGVTAAGFAYLIGKPILRLKAYFLALATLGFGEIFLVIARESHGLTGGVVGIFGIPWFSLAGFSFDTYVKQYYLVWGILVGLLVFSRNLTRSKMGRAFLAVAASEEATASVAIDVPRVKIAAFILAAVFAGFAGSLFASVMSTANPDAFGLSLSVLIVMMVILGGMGNLYGPVAAAVFLTWMTDRLAAYQEYSLPAYGVILILLLIFFPDGIGSRLGTRFVYLISYWPKKRRRNEREVDGIIGNK